MVFKAQKELLELNFQVSSTAGRLQHLEREAGFMLRQASDRGIPPESLEAALNLLELVDRELVHIDHEIGRCRELIHQVFKAATGGDPLFSSSLWDNETE